MYSWKIFSPFCLLHHPPINSSLRCVCRRFFSMRSALSVVGLIFCAFGVLFRKFLPVPVSQRVLPAFSPSILKLSGLMLRPVVHLHLGFLQGER